jgi:ankyrin repeat protein
MKEAYRRAGQQPQAVSPIIAAFFFNARGSRLEKSPLGLFRSVLHQILQRDHQLLTEMLQNFQEKERTQGKSGGQWEWHLGELQHFFKLAFTKPNRHRTMMFVDALDECDERCIRDLVHYFRSVTDFAYAAGSDLNICLASRHYPAITVQRCPEITVQCGNKADIVRYVNVKLHDSSQVDSTTSSLAAQVVRKASGIFLWVVLVVEMLIEMIDDGKTAKDMEDILNDVPVDLEELFSDLFRTLKPNERPKAVKLLQWVLLAERPLSPADICLAIAFTSDIPYMSLQKWKTSGEYVRSYEQMVRMIRSYSRGLIEVTDSVVQFIHESVRELFLRGNGFAILDNTLGLHAIGKGHFSISRACVNLINIEELGSVPFYNWQDLNQLVSPGWRLESPKGNSHWIRPQLCSLCSASILAPTSMYLGCLSCIDSINPRVPQLHPPSDNSSILRYAADSLFHHSQQAEYNGVVPHHLVDLLSGANTHLWERWKALRRATQFSKFSDLVQADVPLLHALCIEGLISCAQRLLEHKANIDAKDKDGVTVLHWAAKNGHKAVVKLLLEHKADVNVKETSCGLTALHWAAKNGHKAVVKLLLEHKADVNVKETGCGLTALHWAAKNGHEAVVKLLAGAKADINMKDTSYGWTALHRTAERGHEVMVKLLVEAKADANVKDRYGRTALYWAAERGHEAVVKLLVEAKADVNAKGTSYGRTALHRAAKNGHGAVAKLLVEAKTDVNVKDSDGWTALHWAAERGHEAVAKLLVEAKADVNAKETSYGWTALHWVAKDGHEVVVKLLVEAKADVNAKETSYGWTALHWAAENRHEAVVKLLVEAKADVDVKDRYRRMALHSAAKNGHEAVVKLLVEAKADINVRNSDGWTALHWAAGRGHEAVVKLLVEAKADVDVKDRYGRMALYWAAKNGCEAVVKLLQVGSR